MELSADEKDLLAFIVRTSDAAAVRAKCKELGLVAEDKAESAAGTFVNALCRRQDAKLYMDQQRKQLERNRLDAMKEADSAGWNREKARAELEQESYDLALKAVRHNLNIIESVERGEADAKSVPSGSSIAKLLDICRSMAGEKGGRRPKTPEEQRDLLRAAGLLKDDEAAKPLPLPTTSVDALSQPEGKA